MAQGACNATKGQSVNLSPSENDIYLALSGWLSEILPSQFNIRKAQLNRVPTPLTPFVQMLIITRHRYATNRHTQNSDGTVTTTQPMLMTIQVSIYGEQSGNASALISTLWRDDNATSWFKKHLPEVAPCKSSEPRQNAWIDASEQYVDGWNLDLVLDVQTSTVTPSPSALSLNTQLNAADLISLRKE